MEAARPARRLTPRAPDGSEVVPGSVIAELEGPARAILTGERVALNFIVHLSGVATATSKSTPPRPRRRG